MFDLSDILDVPNSDRWQSDKWGGTSAAVPQPQPLFGIQRQQSFSWHCLCEFWNHDRGIAIHEPAISDNISSYACNCA